MTLRRAPLLREGLSRRRMAASGMLLVVLSGLSAPLAAAHRGRTVLSTVEWNERTATLEVIHRIHADDAEAALRLIDAGRGFDITHADALTRLALYVDANFAVWATDRLLPLELIGAELEADTVLVFQGAPLTAPAPEIAVRNTIFASLFEAQVNLVNLRVGGRTRSAVFDGGETPRRIAAP